MNPTATRIGETGEATGAEMLRDWSGQDLDLLLTVDHVLSTIERSDPDTANAVDLRSSSTCSAG